MKSSRFVEPFGYGLVSAVIGAAVALLVTHVISTSDPGGVVESAAWAAFFGGMFSAYFARRE